MKPLKIRAYLDNFFFIVSKGDPRKNAEKPMYSYGNFSAFWKLWKKSCLNKLKFWEASRNQKRSIYRKFKLSISLGTQKSAKTPLPGAKMIRPFWLPIFQTGVLFYAALLHSVTSREMKLAEHFLFPKQNWEITDRAVGMVWKFGGEGFYSYQKAAPYLAGVLGLPEHPQNLGVHKRGKAWFLLIRV